MEGIRARGLAKRFGSVLALDGLELDVRTGEIVALLGPNGAGKSTLLRILSTVVLPDAGSASVCGVDVVVDSVEARRRIGLLIGDEHSLYWRLSGYENLRFFGVLYGLGRREANSRARRLLSEVRLEDAADRPVFGYSSGMKTRLALARALIADPPLLLLDEPTRNLDPLAAARFRGTATENARRRGTGILFATHDLHEAVAIATRVLVLSQGRVVLEQSVEGLDAARLEAAFLEAIDAHREQPPAIDHLVRA